MWPQQYDENHENDRSHDRNEISARHAAAAAHSNEQNTAGPRYSFPQ
jgi:hypothetical protein